MKKATLSARHRPSMNISLENLPSSTLDSSTSENKSSEFPWLKLVESFENIFKEFFLTSFGFRF